MKKNEVLIEIINLYDRLGKLESELECQIRHSNVEPKGKVESDIDRLTKIEKFSIDYAKKKLFKELLYSWVTDVHVRKDEKTGRIRTISYEAWLNSAIDTNKIPHELSKKEVLDITGDLFRAKYEEIVTASITEFRNKAKEEVQDERL